MKRIVYFILPIIFTACSSDFIDLKPKSTVTIDFLYKTDKDFQDAIFGAYSILQSQFQNMYIFGDVRADDSEVHVVKTNSHSDADLFITNSNDGVINSTWRNYYNIIFRVNTVLSLIENADPAVVKNKNKHIAECKFLRAFAYFDLVRIYGDVPLVTKPLSATEALKTPREKVDAVYELIISDFLSCESDLPVSYSGTDVGRATRGAAKAILGKVYLTRHDFAKAESKLQEVTTMGYKLLDDYNSLFDYTKDEHHSEYIFDVEYASGQNVSNNITNNFLPNQASFLAFYGIMGIGGETQSPSEELRKLFEDTDKRKFVTVATYGGWINAAGDFVAFPPATSRSWTKKYVTAIPSSNDSPANWKVTRYGDVVLMYAEALNENGKTNDALTWLNMVRARAGVSAYSGLSQSETREAIYKERRLELSFEGHRWFDLVRYGRAYETMAFMGMKPYMTIFPVPWSQIQVVNDKSVFWQNEGYF